MALTVIGCGVFFSLFVLFLVLFLTKKSKCDGETFTTSQSVDRLLNTPGLSEEHREKATNLQGALADLKYAIESDPIFTSGGLAPCWLYGLWTERISCGVNCSC